MANIQIPNLPAVAALSGEELFEGVQAGTSVKISLGQVIAATRTGTPTTIPLPVSAGGTGVSTITGYIKGSGTTPFTGSATIPNTDITGLGTMSTQNANAVAITGGAINNTPIGDTTASTITGTTGVFSDELFIADKIVHSGDSNTSIRFPAANTVTMETNGAERMRIDSAGNVEIDTNTLFVDATNNRVGVGTISPSSALDVVGNIASTSALTVAGPDSTASATMLQAFRAGVGVQTGGACRIHSIGDGTGDAVTMVFDTNSQEAMRIDSVGNVGIGTTNPVSPLHVYLTDATTYGDGTAALDTTNLIRVQNDSEVNDTYSGIQLVSENTTGTQGWWTIASVSTASNYDNDLVFNTRTGASTYAERMRIDSVGNVGIGTSSPASTLDVVGSIAATSSILSSGTDGIGYATGAGTAVTQTISRTTATPTTGADPCGAITVFTAAAVVGTYFSFTVPNTGIAVTDTVVLTVRGGTNTYIANCSQITAATSFRVTMVSVAGTASDTPIVNFTIIKGVSA
jgi:hypothetical protein